VEAVSTKSIIILRETEAQTYKSKIPRARGSSKEENAATLVFSNIQYRIVPVDKSDIKEFFDQYKYWKLPNDYVVRVRHTTSSAITDDLPPIPPLTGNWY
jgi:hypothetical protein